MKPELSQHRQFNETQLKILEAAINCVKQWGIDKTNLNDIAKEAGVTRPTVYSYFNNRNEVIRTALLQSGYEFGERLIKHIDRFDNDKDRLLEAIMFALNELPKEPYLAVITQADLSSYLNEDALRDEEGISMCMVLFSEILRDHPKEEKDMLEIIEISARVMLSLLVMKGPVTRTKKENRDFLERRLIPGIGL